MSVILVDIGGVLVDVDFMRFCRGVSRYGHENEERELFQRYCCESLKKNFDKGALAPFDFLQTLSRDSALRPMSLRRIKASWQDIFTPKPEAGEALGWIRERHTLWIMSDTDPLHFTALLSCCEALKLADRYVLSYEQGYLKQESESFRALLADSGRNPWEFILIDDREENCRCVTSMGIRSLLFRNWAQTIETLSGT